MDVSGGKDSLGLSEAMLDSGQASVIMRDTMYLEASWVESIRLFSQSLVRARGWRKGW